MGTARRMFTGSRGERIDMSDINKQLKDFSVALSKYREGVHEKETKFVTVACAEIERQAKTLMRDTAVDMRKHTVKEDITLVYRVMLQPRTREH